MSKVVFGIWIITAALELFLVTQPVGIAVQLSLSISVVIGLGLIWGLRLGGVWRHIFLALASIVVLRYAFWRTTSTLPPTSDIYSFIPGLILYLAEMYCIVMLAISLFVIADPKRRTAAPKLPADDAPTVDVLVPSYNEGTDILALTLSAAKAMEYPAGKLKVFLLDDGATEEKLHSDDPEIALNARNRAAELKALCARLGVTYSARQRNVHAKAGNLNSGLAISSGDLVVVFDADHAPERHFLSETVGYFATDPKLFLVQTPHFFSNPDPIERNLGTFASMPSENEMFYGRIQLGLDRWNASFFCGSAAVLRREALEQAGGFSGITITEDAETALDLHARGWNSIYVDKPLISGLQPDTFASFIGQRSRWCRGMVQILLLKNPLFQRGLSFAQRICYLSSSLFWMFPLARMVFFIAPLLLILFNLKIYVSSLDEFIAYTVMYLVVSEMIRSYLYGSVRWPWVSEIYEYVQSVYLIGAIFSVLLSPRRPTFNVTAKGQNVETDRLSELSLPYFVIFALSCVAMFVCAYRYQTEPEISGLLAVVGLWQFINLVLSGAALGVVTERGERREKVRLASRSAVEILKDDQVLPGIIRDISPAGATIMPIGQWSGQLRRGDDAVLRLMVDDGTESDRRLPVRIAHGETAGDAAIGATFELATKDYPALAHLMLNDMSPARAEREKRQRSRSFFRASWNLLVWATTSPLRFVWLAFAGRRGPDRTAPSPRTARPLIKSSVDVA